MKIKIGKQIKPLANKYKFKVDFMFGDGDQYQDEEVLVDKDDPDLLRFINFLEFAENLSGEDIENNEDFKYFYSKKGSIELSWPSYEGDILFDLNFYSITYFNELGEQFAVEIEK